MIEVGEKINTVCRRFLDSCMTAEQAAARMDVPVKFVKGCMKKKDKGPNNDGAALGHAEVHIRHENKENMKLGPLIRPSLSYR